MAAGRLLLNVRIGSVHIMNARKFPFVTLYDNPAHRVGSGLDQKTKLRVGEFRSKPKWRPFAAYRLFGLVR